MRTYTTLIWIFLIFFFVLPIRTMGQNKKLVYNPSKIERKSIKIHEKGYEKIVFENAFYNNEAGKPDVPVLY